MIWMFLGERPTVENMSVSHELAVIQYSSKKIICELKKNPTVNLKFICKNAAGRMARK